MSHSRAPDIPGAESAVATAGDQSDARDVSWLDACGSGLVGLGMFFAPLISLQPVAPPPVITYADLFLVAGLLLLTPRLLRQPLRAPAPYLIAAAVVVWIALLSITLHRDVAESTSGALRLGYAAVVLPLALAWWNPSSPWRARLALCYFVGCLFSLTYGLIDGPREDGRYLGLATHPNGFGISLVLGLSLVPYLVSRPSAHRWALALGAAFGAYGVWISGSRAALAVLVLLFIVYLVVERSGGALVLLLMAAVVLAGTWTQLAAAGGSNALVRLLGVNDSTDAGDATDQRRDLLIAGFQEITEHPLLGGGFDEIRAAHNIYVQVGAAIGLVALAAFVLMLVWLVVPLLLAPRPTNRLAYPALGFVLVGPLTDTLADTSIWAAVSLSALVLSERKQL